MQTFDFIKRHQRHAAGAERHFARARLRNPVLAAHASAAQAIELLRTPIGSASATKAELTDALLREVRGGHALLAEVLLEGYLPTLEFLLSFEGGLVLDQELREAMMLEAFSEAIAEYRGGEADPCRHLLRETRRRFRLAARRFHREHAPVDLVDPNKVDAASQHWWEGKSEVARKPRSLRASLAECAVELCDLLRRLVGQEVPRRKLELVEATLLQGEDLATYVARRFPRQWGRQRARTYARLQRERFRTLGSLRTVLAPWRLEVLGGAAR